MLVFSLLNISELFCYHCECFHELYHILLFVLWYVDSEIVVQILTGRIGTFQAWQDLTTQCRSLQVNNWEEKRQLLSPALRSTKHLFTITLLLLSLIRSGDVAAVATVDRWLIFYNLVTMEMLKYHRLEEQAVSLLTTRDGRYMVSAGNGVTIWNPNTG